MCVRGRDISLAQRFARDVVCVAALCPQRIHERDSQQGRAALAGEEDGHGGQGLDREREGAEEAREGKIGKDTEKEIERERWMGGAWDLQKALQRV